jgi:hypothetical protein
MHVIFANNWSTTLAADVTNPSNGEITVVDTTGLPAYVAADEDRLAIIEGAEHRQLLATDWDLTPGVIHTTTGIGFAFTTAAKVFTALPAEALANLQRLGTKGESIAWFGGYTLTFGAGDRAAISITNDVSSSHPIALAPGTYLNWNRWPLASTVELILYDPGAVQPTVTWPANVVWADAIAPVFAAGRNLLRVSLAFSNFADTNGQDVWFGTWAGFLHP